MSTRFRSEGAPKSTHDKLHGWVGELRRASLMGAGDGRAPDIGDPYEVKYLSIQQVAEGDLTGNAQAKRWRHLIKDGGQSLGELELDETHEPIALHEGTAKEGLQAALEVANQLDGDFEASVITSPPIRFIALLISSESESLVIPYSPDETPLENYLPINVLDAAAALKPLAVDVQREAASDEPTGG